MINEPIIWKYLGYITSYLDDKLNSSIFKRLIFVLIYPFIIMLFILIGITFSIIEIIMNMFIISPIKYIIYGREGV